MWASLESCMGMFLRPKTCQGSLELVLYFDVLCMKLYDFYDL